MRDVLTPSRPAMTQMRVSALCLGWSRMFSFLKEVVIWCAVVFAAFRSAAPPVGLSHLLALLCLACGCSSGNTTISSLDRCEDFQMSDGYRGLTSDLGHKEARRRMPGGRKNEIRMGNSKVLVPPVASQVPSNSLFGPDWQKFPGTTILDVNLLDSELSDYPGSWVMTISGKVLNQIEVPPNIEPYAGAVAYIEYGTGGVQKTVEVDAWRNVIGIPSDTLRVNVAYTQLTNVAPTPGYPNNYFPEVEYSATVRRSLETGEAIPTRTYWVLADGFDVDVPVPPMATHWTYIPSLRGVGDGDMPMSGDVQVFSGDKNIGGGTGTVIERVIPEVTASMARMHCFRPLPRRRDFSAYPSMA